MQSVPKYICTKPLTYKTSPVVIGLSNFLAKANLHEQKPDKTCFIFQNYFIVKNFSGHLELLTIFILIQVAGHFLTTASPRNYNTGMSGVEASDNDHVVLAPDTTARQPW